MEIYLSIAGKIYITLRNKKKYPCNLSKCLNYLIKEIRKEIVGTDLKLKLNHLNFTDGFKTEIKFLDLDISLIPNCMNKYEFILWLAGFIEKITVGGKEVPPAFKVYVPVECNYLKNFSMGKVGGNKSEVPNEFDEKEFWGDYKKYYKV
ncbi:hypothetical protein [Acinetobacter courvalinii]|uniref:Uncharacterized protein n=1 Tax=Acinetobacter courvalinii TaxID=280147 RepID=N9PVV8_9GAMM|nr:hypothetical protein [Acinetobacter courvalinii]ENX37628.1 hypothetical protein F888_02970 [Acinetobacter courvalinii]KAB0658964.1 hypothetical protein F7P77_14975 [Acinetobacter courvalinii]GGH26197.1 hypothetical protein GCM10007354_03470 [Acinetobacter courvalinii]